MKRRTQRIEAGEAGALLETIVDALTSGRGRELIDHGAVYVRGKRVTDPAFRLREGDVVSAVLEERGRDVLEARTVPTALRVLVEDEAFVAIDKHAGIAAQPTPGGEVSLLDLVRTYLGREPGLVHRLDRETSGVTIFGKSPEATRALAERFRLGDARKQYVAICGPALPEAGLIDLPLSKDPSRPGRFRATTSAHGIPAQTDFRRLGSFPDHALVVLFPRTGRTHQLRAHLTALDAPICGDARYGGARTIGGAPVERCLLHAHVLTLPHPITRAPLTIVAPIPEDMARIFTADGVAMPSQDLLTGG